MAWWLPLIAAAVNSAEEEQKKAKARQDALDETLNHIRQSHASAAGAQPYAGIASNFATELSRFQRDNEPANNAVGAAIQALGKSADHKTAAPLLHPHLSAEDFPDPWAVDKEQYI